MLGHGVEDPADGIHGDEEYLYVVELPSRTAFEEPGEWTVTVSDQCGFEDAFEQATWQFRGPLTEAIDELIAETV